MKKTKRFGVLLTKEESIALTQLAELEGGLSKAALIRRLIRNAAVHQSIWPYQPSRDVSNRSKEVGSNT